MDEDLGEYKKYMKRKWFELHKVMKEDTTKFLLSSLKLTIDLLKRFASDYSN